MMTASARIDRTFSALADPTRRPFAISLPAISRHLRVLEAAALVRQERDGQFRRCRLDAEGLQSAAEWLDFYRHFWSESLDRLDEHLKSSSSTSRADKTKGRTHGKRKARARR